MASSLSPILDIIVSPFLSLPWEITCTVISFLKPKDLLNLQLVAKVWAEETKHDRWWQPVYCFHWNLTSTCNVITKRIKPVSWSWQQLFRNRVLVEKEYLKVSPKDNINKSSTKEWILRAKKLEKIVIPPNWESKSTLTPSEQENLHKHITIDDPLVVICFTQLISGVNLQDTQFPRIRGEHALVMHLLADFAHFLGLRIMEGRNDNYGESYNRAVVKYRSASSLLQFAVDVYKNALSSYTYYRSNDVRTSGEDEGNDGKEEDDTSAESIKNRETKQWFTALSQSLFRASRGTVFLSPEELSSTLLNNTENEREEDTRLMFEMREEVEGEERNIGGEHTIRHFDGFSGGNGDSVELRLRIPMDRRELDRESIDEEFLRLLTNEQTLMEQEHHQEERESGGGEKEKKDKEEKGKGKEEEEEEEEDKKYINKDEKVADGDEIKLNEEEVGELEEVEELKQLEEVVGELVGELEGEEEEEEVVEGDAETLLSTHSSQSYFVIHLSDSEEEISRKLKLRWKPDLLVLLCNCADAMRDLATILFTEFSHGYCPSMKENILHRSEILFQEMDHIYRRAHPLCTTFEQRELFETWAWSYRERAKFKIQCGDIQEAVECFSKAEELYDKCLLDHRLIVRDDADVLEGHAYTLREHANIETDPETREALYVKCHHRYKAALEVQPCPIILSNFADMCRQHAESIEDLEAAEALFEEAYKYYERSISLSKEDLLTYSNYSMTLISHAKRVEGGKRTILLKEARGKLTLGMEKKDVWTYFCLARYCSVAQLYDECKKWLLMCLSEERDYFTSASDFHLRDFDNVKSFVWFKEIKEKMIALSSQPPIK